MPQKRQDFCWAAHSSSTLLCRISQLSTKAVGMGNNGSWSVISVLLEHTGTITGTSGWGYYWQRVTFGRSANGLEWFTVMSVNYNHFFNVVSKTYPCVNFGRWHPKGFKDNGQKGLCRVLKNFVKSDTMPTTAHWKCGTAPIWVWRTCTSPERIDVPKNLWWAKVQFVKFVSQLLSPCFGKDSI